MTTTTLADAKNRLSEIIADVERTHERTIITKNGRPTVALVALDDLEGLEETLEILSNPADAAAVRDAIVDDSPALRVTKQEMAAVLAERRRQGGRGLSTDESDAIIAAQRRRGV